MLILNSAIANADTVLKIITNKGYVSFTVGDDWPVISMQSKLPIAAAGFQIPNPADKGTPDSTNLALMLYDLSTDRGKAVFESPIKQYGANQPQMGKYGEWTLYRQQAQQGSTRYTIIDSKKMNVADVSVSTRISWPHLTSDSKQHNANMESLLYTFLDSIKGTLGTLTPNQNEVIRRPEK